MAAERGVLLAAAVLALVAVLGEPSAGSAPPEGGADGGRPDDEAELAVHERDLQAANASTTTLPTAAPTTMKPLPRSQITKEMDFCMSFRPVLGVWFTGFVISSSLILVWVIRRLSNGGAMYAMPRLSGLRYSLFGALWIQGVMSVIQAFRHDSGDGCTIMEPYLIVGRIPLPPGSSIASPLPNGITDLAVFIDTLVSGHIVILLLVALPRMRVNYDPHAYVECGVGPLPVEVTRRCSIPVMLLLIVVNPLVAVLTIRQNLKLSLWLEFSFYVLGVVLSWATARSSRAHLAYLFEHIYVQEWTVLYAAIVLRLMKIAVAELFLADTACFINAMLSSFAVSAVVVFLNFNCPPHRDPLLWLAGQEWLLSNTFEDETEAQERHKRHNRKAFLRFVVSMLNFRHAFELLLKYDLHQWLGWDVGLNRPWDDVGEEKMPDELRELQFGQAAWKEWDRWAEKVCKSWPGLKREGVTCKSLKDVCPPASLTPREETLKKEGGLTRRSMWRFVHGDFFSDRVYSQELSVIVLAILLMQREIWRLMLVNLELSFLDTWDTGVKLLVQSLVICFCLWLLISVILCGNNVFMPAWLGEDRGRRLWLFMLAALAAFCVIIELTSLWLKKDPIPDSANIDVELSNLLYRWFQVVYIMAFLSLLNTLLRLAFMQHVPQVRNTYHRLEFAAQRYCQRLLEGQSTVAKAQKDHVFQLNWNGAPRPCLVTHVREKAGTCSVVLQGGHVVDNVLQRALQPLRTDARLVTSDKNFDWSTALNDIFVGASNLRARLVDAGIARTTADDPDDPDGVAAEPQHESGRETPATMSAFQRFKHNTKNLGDAEQHLVNLATTIKMKEPDKQSKSEHRQPPMRPTLHVSEEDYGLVRYACLGGEMREKAAQRVLRQAEGFRIFFGASVGLPSLLLTALMLGLVVVVLVGAVLAAEVHELEHGISRMHSGAAYALRVQSYGFHYGACGPPSHPEEEACARAIGRGACVPHAEGMLVWAFDRDRSGTLEDGEVAHLATILSAASVAAAASGTELSALTRTDIQRLLQQARHPQQDWHTEDSLQRLLCDTSKLLSERNAQAQQTLNSLQNFRANTTGNISIAGLFPLADKNPQDGYLTEQELLALVPSSFSGVQGIQGGATTWSQAVRLGFLLADTRPADSRLSLEEANTAVAYVSRLMANLPRLMAEISAVQSGQKSSLDVALLISVLDVDGDGAVSRIEIGVLAMALEGSSPGASGQVLMVFDAVDSDGDGMIRQADLSRLSQQLSSGLVLLSMLSNPNTALTQKNLLAALDTDGDGALSRAEFDRLASLLPAQYSSQAAFLVSLLFGQADTTPRDGRLSGGELDVAAQRLQGLLQQFSQAVPTPPTLATPRRLAAESGEAAVAVAAGRRTAGSFSDDVSNGFDLLAALLGFGASTFFEGEQHLIKDYIKRFLWVFNSDEFRIISPLVLMGMRISIVGAGFSAFYMMMRTKDEHERLTMRIQTGDHSYIGYGQKALLRNSFSTSTSFPGIFVATLLINFITTLVLIFLSLVIVATPIVLLCLDGTRAWMWDLIWSLRFVVLVSIVKYVLKAVVVDWFLVDHGQPVYPAMFAPLWLTLILLNLVQAPFFAVFRWASLVIYSTFAATYLHVCAVEESLLSLDPGYYAFISLTFTQSARRNLVRTCFISALMPQCQRAQGKPPPPDVHEPLAGQGEGHIVFPREAAAGAAAEDPERARRTRRLRIRNKLWVAVTLSNNPELRSTRRISREREFASLITLWDNQDRLSAGPAPSASHLERDGPPEDGDQRSKCAVIQEGDSVAL